MGTDVLRHALDLAISSTLVIGVVVSIAFSLAAGISARTFRRQRGAPLPHSPLPGVTVLKPLHGSDAYLYDNLRSLCRQNYPTVQIVCGVRDPDDPAIPVVERLQREHPECQIDLVIDGRLYGSNRKVSNLHNMYRVARHDVLVIADSDVRVPPDYLRRLAGAVADPGVGVVSCLYRAENTATLPARVESLFINTDFVPMVLVARLVEKPTYAFGATMAIRRTVLDESGGFLPFADLLADDYHLGQRVAERGYSLVLSEQVVGTVFAVDSWRHAFEHQLRWARTNRACRPFGYFFSILGHGTLWALLVLLSFGIDSALGRLAVAALGLRGLVAVYVATRTLRGRLTAFDLALLPFTDLAWSLLWLLAFTGNTVVWRGTRYRLRPGGRIDLLTTDGTCPASPARPARDEPGQPAASAG